MIPSSSAFLAEDLEITEQPTYTYKMNLETKRIRGYAEGLAAMEQAIYKILLTERYQYTMYSWNYGIELDDLYGEAATYVIPELERRITEALTWDDRIDSVDGFEFDTSKKSIVHVSFTVHTQFGDVEAEKEVNV